METPRERYFITNSMICLLKAVEGFETTVELRNEKIVEGHIDKVDGYMNISMSNVTLKLLLTGEKKKFDSFFVNGKSIRYVHIPDEINMRKSMDKVLKRYCSVSANIRVRDEIQSKAWQKMKQKENEAKTKQY